MDKEAYNLIVALCLLASGYVTGLGSLPEQFLDNSSAELMCMDSSTPFMIQHLSL
jgi:hypothetical protein